VLYSSTLLFSILFPSQIPTRIAGIIPIIES
jgi:hypothetical protein